MDGLHINVLNPPKGTGKARRQMAKAKRGKDGKFLPRGRGRSTAVARRRPRRAPKRRRRRNNPGGGGGGTVAPRRRRANPRGGGMFGGGGTHTINAGLRNFWPRFLGKLWVVWVVRRFGAMAGGAWGTGSAIPGLPATQSPFAGRSWTMGNYIVGYLGLKFAANMLGGNRGRDWANNFFHGGFDALATKLVWTEAFARVPWLQQQFGQTGHQGQVMQDPQTGQTYMMQGGQWQALQGTHGQVAEAGPLDGFGQIVTASPLDAGELGQIVQADEYDGYGQMMPPGATTRQESLDASYGHRGSRDPYIATYMGSPEYSQYTSAYT